MDSWAANFSSKYNPPSLLVIRDYFNDWLLETKAVFDRESSEPHIHNHGCNVNENYFNFVWGTYETWLKDRSGNVLVDALLNSEDLFERKLYKSIADALHAAIGVQFPLNHPASKL